MAQHLRTPVRPYGVVAALTWALLLFAFLPAAARELIPTPEGGGVGESTLAVDNPTSSTPLRADWREAELEREARSLTTMAGAKDVLPTDFIGGSDVLVSHDSYWLDMDIASNGDIYVASHSYDGFRGIIEVHRSQDGGQTFSEWGLLEDTEFNFGKPSLMIAEGAENRCYIAYSRDGFGTTSRVIGLVHAELSGATATFSPEVTVFGGTGLDFSHVDIASDAATYSSYYIYIVAQDNSDLGGDVWYARSIDRGDSVESPYVIGDITGANFEYVSPRVCWGYGGVVHVAWAYRDRTLNFDGAIRYRRNTSSGGGGLAYWDSMKQLTANSDNVYDMNPVIRASLSSFEVEIVHESREYDPVEGYTWLDPGLALSADQGATFGTVDVIVGGVPRPRDLLLQPATNGLVLSGAGDAYPLIQYGAFGGGDTWSDVVSFADSAEPGGQYLESTAVAVNPDDDRIATVWNHDLIGGFTSILYFDAEWRGDEGYPNMGPYMPRDLTAAPVSSPAIVEFQAGAPTIVFGDADGFIQAFSRTGFNRSGWPVDVGTPLSTSPIAIGDLSDIGRMIVVAGTADGRVFAYDGLGQLLSGFPYDFGTGEPAYVAIGALGGPYPRTIAAVSGTRIVFLNHRSVTPPLTYNWTFGGRKGVAPPAIGDVNGDGVAEAVFLAANDAGDGGLVFACNLHENTPVLERTIPSIPSDAPTLADLDLDGDVEIAVPCADGTMYMLDDDGTDLAGWPVTTASGSACTSAAMVNILGSYEPEVIFAARNWTLEYFSSDGTRPTGWPEYTTTGWYILAAPVIGSVYSYSADIVLGARDRKIWCWDNIYVIDEIGGWPFEAGDVVHQAAAFSDIDLDGDNDLVVLTQSQVMVLDVNNPYPDGPDEHWPMDGYDHQRTGCIDCDEDLVTSVDPDDDDLVTGLAAFAAPYPNPTSGATQFSFSLPVRCQTRLEVFDTRGRLVRSVLREEVAEGQHTVGWDGLASDGREASSGTYFARLRIRGPGVDRMLSRKINMIR